MEKEEENRSHGHSKPKPKLTRGSLGLGVRPQLWFPGSVVVAGGPGIGGAPMSFRKRGVVGAKGAPAQHGERTGKGASGAGLGDTYGVAGWRQDQSR